MTYRKEFPFIIEGAMLMECDESAQGHIVVPEGVGGIAIHAFRGCSGVTDITLPDSMEILCTRAFEGCDNLATINIPSKVPELFHSLFRDCSKLREIKIEEGVEQFWPQVFKGCSSMRSIAIPSSVTKISADTFLECQNLKDIEVAEGNPAYCAEGGVLYDKGHTKVICSPAANRAVLPPTIEHIGPWAFYHNTRLESVEIPEEKNGVKIMQY